MKYLLSKHQLFSNNFYQKIWYKFHPFDHFYSNITQILDTLDIPDNLEKIGVKDNKITELAIKSSKDSAAFTNPKKASIEDLEKIIKKTIKKAR